MTAEKRSYRVDIDCGCWGVGVYGGSGLLEEHLCEFHAENGKQTMHPDLRSAMQTTEVAHAT
jgi:hypothetical protein